MTPILLEKMSKRNIDVDCLEFGNVAEMNKRARQQISVKEGLDKDLARKMVKQIKDSKLKVQAAIQGDQLRVTGKKRDELQQRGLAAARRTGEGHDGRGIAVLSW